MKEGTTPPPAEPGTLTSLVNEVFRGSGEERSAWVEALTPGEKLGRYDLIREVGRGGSGVVWEARDRDLGRRVAVKVIRRPPGGAPEKRLVAEAEVAARLSHPGIVTILDVGRNEKGAWLVQEFLVGETLAARLGKGPLSLRDALRVAVKVAAALAYAHGHGVVHRDLTPANVFLCEDGQVKLLDLGMAQAFVLGEPVDERVDVYALGALLSRMVTGEAPFPPDVPPENRQTPRVETPELPGLGALAERMLAAEPRERPRDAATVLAELETLESSLPRLSSTAAPGRSRVRGRKPRWVLLAGGAILLVAAGVVGGAIGGTIGRTPASPPSMPPGIVAVGAVATSNACKWVLRKRVELDALPEGAITRNGAMGGQGVAEVAGRKAWQVTSDWGQLILPLDLDPSVDVFAVEAEFFLPPEAGWMRGVGLGVFNAFRADGKVGILDRGVGLVIAKEPGKPPYYDWYEPDDAKVNIKGFVRDLNGTITGEWHTLRIEGSRSQRWARGLLDGRAIVFGYGDIDFTGTKILLGVGYGSVNPEDAAWSNLRIFTGTPECQ